MTPDFSLLMCVCSSDDPSHFSAALKSVTQQQTLSPSEAIIVIDGSVAPDVQCIIKSVFATTGIPYEVIQNETRKGLAFSLNRGLEHCSYEWAARMDADDISLPNRFLEQMSFLARNPSVSVLGSSVIEFGDVPNERMKTAIRDTAEIAKVVRIRNPFNHPSCIINVNHVLNVGGYPLLEKNQDYALWVVLLSKGYELTNMDQALLKFRVTSNFFSKRGLNLLKHDVAVLRLLLSYKKISLLLFFVLAFLRTILRLLPESALRLAYVLSR